MSLYSWGAVCIFVLVQLPSISSRQVDAFRRSPSASSLITSSVTKIACTGNETFPCADGRCIPRSWVCDADIDCKGEEDEKDCNDVKCAEGEFKCGDVASGPFKANHNPCIPSKWQCDGQFDCDDRSDEMHCEDVHCTDQQFTCNEFDGQYKLCIPITWQCDGQKDCASGEDEEGCKDRSCRNTDFTCANNVCIFKNWVCDGEDDCGDGSDEKNCTSTPDQLCEEKHMFKCKKSGCIPTDWICDGEADCLDHSDERNCAAKPHQCRRPTMEFACASGSACISKMWICDGEEDCSDGSDEKDCVSQPCAADEFKCHSNKMCISHNMVCDGNEDCSDGSDEKQNCTKTDTLKTCNEDTEFKCPGEPIQCIALKEFCKTKNNVCSSDAHECRTTLTKCAKGSEGCECHKSFIQGTEFCYCKAGFRSENNKCIDIDECNEQHGVCDQTCHNTIGGYECECIRGYKLSHEEHSPVPNKCRAVGGDPIVLLSNRASIRQYDLVTNTYAPLIQSPGSAVAMDFHLQDRILIWSDISQRKIMKCDIGNDSDNHHLAPKSCNKDKVYVVAEGVHTPDGLAIDWVHNLLFWTDGGLDEVNVMDLVTKKRRTLFTLDMEEPRAIAVDPEMGLIFWTDWGKEARIERAGMNGQDRVVIVKGDRVKWPNGLALDYVNKRVYWADAKIKSIFSCDYWGHDVKTVLHSHDYLRHPFSMAVFEDRVYYTDWENDGVNSVNKFNGGEPKKVMQKVTTPMTVRIYHQMAQPDLENKCKNHNCGDKSICLPRAHYREVFEKKEHKWNDRPFECMCGTESGSACAVDIVTQGASSGFSLSTLLFFLMLAIFTVMGVVYYRRRKESSNFTALNFDNPIYRRTVEADMDDPFRDPFADDARNSRLVIGTQDGDNEIQNPAPTNGSLHI